ncbi:MAG: hypothetical protein FGM36_08865 [Burkholderiaceae bacterium]|jgi:hypothetical protein|nr:hypothetical protein [Burkholderiaceae bacterium]
MKFRTFLITSSLLLSGLAWAGPNDADHKPMHGGILTTVKDIDYELVANPTTLRLYVRDHGKAVDVSKASAKLTLLTGAEKQEVDLKPSDDKLQAAGAFKVGPGTKIIAVISVGGRQSTARFVLK